MFRKRHTTEQIISKLREAEVEFSKGLTVPLVGKNPADWQKCQSTRLTKSPLILGGPSAIAVGVLAATLL